MKILNKNTSVSVLLPLENTEVHPKIKIVYSHLCWSQFQMYSAGQVSSLMELSKTKKTGKAPPKPGC